VPVPVSMGCISATPVRQPDPAAVAGRRDDSRAVTSAPSLRCRTSSIRARVQPGPSLPRCPGERPIGSRGCSALRCGTSCARRGAADRRDGRGAPWNRLLSCSPAPP
jgi:hypothetical protein